MPYYGFYWDPTYVLVLIGAIICMIASARVRTTYNKYARYASASGMTGAQAADQILRAAGIYDVQIRRVSGSLTDHYDPRNKTLNLSDSVYGSRSVAAVGVAAHECGHAIQDKDNYKPMRIRSKLVPTVNICTRIGYLAILIGIIFSYTLIEIGIILLLSMLVFQLITLPVEFNASKRALIQLEDLNLIDKEEKKSTQKMLSAAAFTYVAALLSTLLEILRYVLIFADRDR